MQAIKSMVQLLFFANVGGASSLVTQHQAWAILTSEDINRY
jgi:hypothetical protein